MQPWKRRLFWSPASLPESGKPAQGRWPTQVVWYGSVRQLEHAQPIKGVTLVQLDVCEKASIDRAVATIIAREGRIDALVNNAGHNLIGAVEETEVVEVESLFDTNVLGVIRAIRAVLPSMRAQRAGRIINVSSVLDFSPGLTWAFMRPASMPWKGCRRARSRGSSVWDTGHSGAALLYQHWIQDEYTASQYIHRRLRLRARTRTGCDRSRIR